MSPKIFTALTLATAAAAGITALALHAQRTPSCSCDQHAEVVPPVDHGVHYIQPHHFARPPAPEPMTNPMPSPSPAPVA